MEYHRFGPTDLTVSVTGFGCSDSATWPSGYDDMAGAIHRAIDLGITCFDTAPNYRESERMLARALGPRRK